jgi:hypothetical protein
VYNLINGADKQYLPHDFVARVWNFEQQLARSTMKKEQRRMYDEYFTNTTLTGIVNEINALRSVSTKNANYGENEPDFALSEPEISHVRQYFALLDELFAFSRILAENRTKYFGAESDEGPRADHITAFDGDNIRRTFALVLNPKNRADYKAYLQYKIIASKQDFLTKALNEEFFDFYSRQLSGQQKQKTEEKRSIQTVNRYAGEMLGKIYVAKFFPPEAKENVRFVCFLIFLSCFLRSFFFSFCLLFVRSFFLFFSFSVGFFHS